MAEWVRRAFDMAINLNGSTPFNIPRDFFYGACEVEICPTPVIRRGAGDLEALEAAAKLAGL
jgi:sulfoacetaldehyde acetyltransferase